MSCGSKVAWMDEGSGMFVNVACTLAPHSGDRHMARLEAAARGIPLTQVEVTVTWTRPSAGDTSTEPRCPDCTCCDAESCAAFLCMDCPCHAAAPVPAEDSAERTHPPLPGPDRVPVPLDYQRGGRFA